MLSFENYRDEEQFHYTEMVAKEAVAKFTEDPGELSEFEDFLNFNGSELSSRAAHHLCREILNYTVNFIAGYIYYDDSRPKKEDFEATFDPGVFPCTVITYQGKDVMKEWTYQVETSKDPEPRDYAKLIGIDTDKINHAGMLADKALEKFGFEENEIQGFWEAVDYEKNEFVYGNAITEELCEGILNTVVGWCNTDRGTRDYDWDVTNYGYPGLFYQGYSVADDDWKVDEKGNAARLSLQEKISKAEEKTDAAVSKTRSVKFNQEHVK